MQEEEKANWFSAAVIKFIYSEKATKFGDMLTMLLTEEYSPPDTALLFGSTLYSPVYSS